MFEDDPNMQEVLAAARARPTPLEKPGWWVFLSFGLLVAGAGAMAGLAYGMDWRVDVGAIFGCLAGLALGWALLGHWSSRFRITGGPRKGERLVMWLPMAPAHRTLFALAVPLLVIVGSWLTFDRAERDAEQARPRKAPAAAHRPAVKPRSR